MIEIKKYETDRINVASPFYHNVIYKPITIKQWNRIVEILKGNKVEEMIGDNKVYFEYK